MLNFISQHDGGSTCSKAATSPASRLRRWLVPRLLAATLLGSAVQAGDFRADLPYPGEVALSKEPRGYLFRRFPGNLPLYVSDADKNAQSACNKGCDTTYVPVYAPPDAKPLGEWIVITRQNGRLQWAYRGQPVYSYFHDSADQPAGEGNGWHLLPYEAI